MTNTALTGLTRLMEPSGHSDYTRMQERSRAATLAGAAEAADALEAGMPVTAEEARALLDAALRLAAAAAERL